MKEPINPIPRDLSLDVKHITGHSVEDGDMALNPSSMRSRVNARVGRVDPAYHWLLIASLLLSSILCWLYVTKPVIVQEVSGADAKAGSETSAASGKGGSSTVGALVPSSDALPGESSSAHHMPKKISPGALTGPSAASAPFSPGWEFTNLKVQHILSADTGGDDLEKIVLDVPVLYESRSLRWTHDDIAKARKLMQRLVVYETNLNQLRNEGQEILQDWNQLIESTMPATVLRADSPSLPHNHGESGATGDLPDSSTLIKVGP